jgi:hypothetical protein
LKWIEGRDERIALLEQKNQRKKDKIEKLTQECSDRREAMGAEESDKFESI